MLWLPRGLHAPWMPISEYLICLAIEVSAEVVAAVLWCGLIIYQVVQPDEKFWCCDKRLDWQLLCSNFTTRRLPLGVGNVMYYNLSFEKRE